VENQDPGCPLKNQTRQDHYVVDGANADGSREQISEEFLGNGYIAEGSGSKDKNSSTGKFKVLSATTYAAKAIREQKAVESDDAAIPEHLWKEHLFDKSGWAEKWKDGQERFRKACCILKSTMIRWWKRTVTRSLSNLIDCRYPHMRAQFDDSKPIVKLESPHSIRKRFAVSKQILMLESDTYSWGGEGGCVMYAKWARYTIRMLDSCIDLVPRSDAVAREANLTLFEWDDGSRPFH
jgi:hypothetical protein